MTKQGLIGIIIVLIPQWRSIGCVFGATLDGIGVRPRVRQPFGDRNLMPWEELFGGLAVLGTILGALVAVLLMWLND